MHCMRSPHTVHTAQHFGDLLVMEKPAPVQQRSKPTRPARRQYHAPDDDNRLQHSIAIVPSCALAPPAFHRHTDVAVSLDSLVVVRLDDSPARRVATIRTHTLFSLTTAAARVIVRILSHLRRARRDGRSLIGRNSQRRTHSLLSLSAVDRQPLDSQWPCKKINRSSMGSYPSLVPVWP